MTFDQWWDTTKTTSTPETFAGWEHSCRQAWNAALAAQADAQPAEPADSYRALVMDYAITAGELSKHCEASDPMWNELQALADRLTALDAGRADAQPVAWTTMPDTDDWTFISGSKDPNGALPGKWYPLFAAAPPARQPQWMPIETAPKDGTRVLVWIDERNMKGFAFAKVWFHADGSLGGGAEGYNGDWNITHWMPLPPPPGGIGEGE